MSKTYPPKTRHNMRPGMLVYVCAFFFVRRFTPSLPRDMSVMSRDEPSSPSVHPLHFDIADGINAPARRRLGVDSRLTSSVKQPRFASHVRSLSPADIRYFGEKKRNIYLAGIRLTFFSDLMVSVCTIRPPGRCVHLKTRIFHKPREKEAVLRP